MSEVPNDATPGGPRDGSWPEAAPPPPAAPTPPPSAQYPAQPAPDYPQAPYPGQPQAQYPVQGQQYPAPGFQQQQLPPQAVSGTVNLNYWLSVFFTWIPALIFFITEKGKNQLADEFHRQNLNFALTRVICSVGMFIPYLGVVFAIAALVLFIMHLMAAINAQSNFNNGQLPKFAFNLNLVK